MSRTADPTGQGDRAAGPSEATPLLGAAEAYIDPSDDATIEPTALNGALGRVSGAAQQPEDKPLPVFQIVLLCLACLAEPIAYFSIFPFVPEMIERTGGLSQAEVGYWAGIIESLFSLVQMLLMIPYGRMCDLMGRKPVLIFSLVGVTCSSALFGLSTTLWQMCLLRMLAGVFSGSSVTLRTMVSENCTKKTQARAFSWYMFARQIGILIGPLCGGTLANPARQFPNTIGKIQFFRDFPYALPSFTSGAICLVLTLINAVYLKETLVRNADGSIKREGLLSTWDVLKAPGVAMVLVLNAHIALLGLSYTAVNPVFQYTPISLGGLSFSPGQISIFLAVAGASQAVWMLFVFPPAQRRAGTEGLLRINAVTWPLWSAMYPVLNELRRAHVSDGVFWVAGIAVVALGSGNAMSYACQQLCINDISPSPSVLATVNALALTVGTAVRAVSPVLFTSIFAQGVTSGWAHGQLFWIVHIAIGALLNVTIYFTPKAAFSKPEEAKAVEDSES